jgi:hypothetical protein
MKGFEAGRKAFTVLRSQLLSDAVLAEELARSINMVLSRYNTQIYENRFLVGGSVERLIAAAFAAIGEPARTVGVSVTRTDLLVQDTHLSVKGVFRPKAAEIRLINTMGNSTGTAWNEPTIAVVSGLGIGYLDPGLLPDSTKRSKDAIAIPLKTVKQFWTEHERWRVTMPIEHSREDKVGSDVASRAVVDEILRYNFRRLRPFDSRSPDQ